MGEKDELDRVIQNTSKENDILHVTIYMRNIIELYNGPYITPNFNTEFQK